MKKFVILSLTLLLFGFVFPCQPAFSNASIEKINQKYSLDGYKPVYENEPVYILEKDGKKGLYNRNYNVLILPQYDKIRRSTLIGHYIVVKNGKKGVIRENTGEIVVSVKYDNVSPFSGGFILENNGKFGVYNIDLDKLLQVEYDKISKLENNIEYIILEKNNKKGIFRNSYADIILPVEYDRIEEGQHGRQFLVEKNGETFYYIADRNTLSPTNFQYTIIDKNLNNTFLSIVESDGLEYVYDLYEHRPVTKGYDKIVKTNSNDTLVLIKDGKKIFFNLTDRSVSTVDSPNYQVFSDAESVVYYQGNKIIVKDKNGDELVDFDIEGAKVTNIVPNKYVIFKKNNKYGWYDIKKDKITDELYSDVKIENSNWFSPITAEKDVAFYEKDGVWHNSKEPALSIKRTVLLPAELIIATAHDLVNIPLFGCYLVFLAMFNIDQSEVFDWWLKKECQD